MSGRYHPLYDSIWAEPKLDGCCLEEIGFAIYLFSNPRVRPSGIYRVLDAQAALDTRISEKKAASYLRDLHERRFIVRDGAWIFVVGYLRLQPKQQFLLRGVADDVRECESIPVLDAFHEQYPLLDQWSRDRRATVGQRLGNHSTRAMQSRAEQSRADAEQSAERSTNGAGPPAGAGSQPIAFKIPTPIQAALERAPVLGQIPKLRDAAWWQAEIRCNRGVDFAAELLKAEAWLRSNPSRGPKSNHARFMHTWLSRADRPRGEAE